jgi:hypothetical protein
MISGSHIPSRSTTHRSSRARRTGPESRARPSCYALTRRQARHRPQVGRIKVLGAGKASCRAREVLVFSRKARITFHAVSSCEALVAYALGTADAAGGRNHVWRAFFAGKALAPAAAVAAVVRVVGARFAVGRPSVVLDSKRFDIRLLASCLFACVCVYACAHMCACMLEYVCMHVVRCAHMCACMLEYVCMHVVHMYV